MRSFASAAVPPLRGSLFPAKLRCPGWRWGGSVVGVYGREGGMVRAGVVADGLGASRAVLAGWASGFGLVFIVAAFTLATAVHALSLTLFAASAARIASGRVWLLVTSALIVDRPVVIGLAAFAVLALVTLRCCGIRVFWLAAAVGHAGSTLIVYAIIGASQLANAQMFTSDAVRPDFGVSAMQAAWVGAITATAWRRAGSDPRARSLVGVGVCAIAGVAWWLHPDPSILTTEHLFAFLIGCTLVSGRALARAARTAATHRFSPVRHNETQHA